MLEMSELVREFEKDASTINRTIEEIARISIDNQEEIKSLKDKIQWVLQSGTLSVEEKEKTHLMLKMLDELQGWIGEWPLIPKVAGILEATCKPDGEHLPTGEMSEIRTQLIEVLAFMATFHENAVSGRFRTPQDFFGWMRNVESSFGVSLLPGGDFEESVYEVLRALPSGVSESEGTKTGSGDLMRFFAGLEFILSIYLKWVNRVLQIQLSLTEQDLSQTERRKVIRKLSSIGRQLQKHIPEFIEKLFTEYLPKAIANYTKTLCEPR